jgi:hypothetical protein
MSMDHSNFDQEQSDSQATPVEPVAVEDFDIGAYIAYEQPLDERCRRFWRADSGVLVYRRMRVAEVFSYGCRDMKASLQWQLGALKKSMDFPADVPNFLEPWYGIGAIAGAYGLGYTWHTGQAPAIKPRFASVVDAMRQPVLPLVDAPIGSRTLAMIDYFLDQTQGRLPMSLADMQSPLNVACQIVDMNRLFLDMYDRPEQVRTFLRDLAKLIHAFTQVQADAIGEMLVWPGHGFASSWCFKGLGLSDDNALMISSPQYEQMVAPAVDFLGSRYDGWAFHSCGDWSAKIGTIKQIPGLRMVDAAFSAATDPSPNDPELFAQALAGTGIIVNARIVGGYDVVVDTVRRLWADGMKLIVVTYCQSPEEQARVYDAIHELCT